MVFTWNFFKTREVVFIKWLGLIWIIPSMLIAIALYAHYPITKERVLGLYQIDTSFYPGENANWQKRTFPSK